MTLNPVLIIGLLILLAHDLFFAPCIRLLMQGALEGFKMRKVFFVSDQSYSTARRYFRKWYPWVEVVARATSGYWGFECRDDYRLWRRQK